MRNICKLTFILVLSLSAQTFAQQQAKSQVVSTEEQLTESVKLAPCKSKLRGEAVVNLFKQLGAAEKDVAVEEFGGGVSNVVVKKAGKSNETIIVGAHYDKVADGCGAIDNWTGVAIIAHLYRTLSQISTDKTYVFVAFDKEESGLLGSEAMAKAIPKDEHKQYCAMVNFDSFGFAVPQVLENVSSAELLPLAAETAQKLKLPVVKASIAFADADSSSFKKRGIPAITFHGLGDKWQNYLHSSKDKIENVNQDSVYYGYRFALLFLVTLDKNACTKTASK